MNLTSWKGKKLKNNEFYLLEAQKAQKAMNLIFWKLNNLRNNELNF